MLKQKALTTRTICLDDNVISSELQFSTLESEYIIVCVFLYEYHHILFLIHFSTSARESEFACLVRLLLK